MIAMMAMMVVTVTVAMIAMMAVTVTVLQER